jgi:prepilin-type N-terminal cleavage/methylation domain-containing protein
MKKRNGFTLVELLAVIVILAIILVIAVPQIMTTIDDATRASFESSVKMVAAQVENQYAVAKTLGKEFATTDGDCSAAKAPWAGLNTTDYDTCSYSIDENGNAIVTIKGKGKFANYPSCVGTRASITSCDKVTGGE